MYHYTESGLSNQYLLNGYKEIGTPYGKAIVIEDVDGLHRCIAWSLVNDKPFLSGPEFRFIRKTLGLTQATIADIIGYDEQTARRWETLGRVPKWADHAIRFVYRDYENGSEPVRGAIAKLQELEQRECEAMRFNWEFKRRRKTTRWKATAEAA